MRGIPVLALMPCPGSQQATLFTQIYLSMIYKEPPRISADLKTVIVEKLAKISAWIFVNVITSLQRFHLFMVKHHAALVGSMWCNR